MPAARPRLELDRFLPYRLSIASNGVSDVIAESYRALFGLRIPEWRLIAVLGEAAPMTQQALGKRTRMDKVTVSRAAIALVGRELIARAAHPGDQRSYLLALTPAGRTLYEEVAPKALEMEARLFEGFDAGEIAALRAMLERLDRAVERLNGQQD